MLTLYGTEGCHLCHEAQSMLLQMGTTWQDVDIIDHPHLLQRYETRIPVLQSQNRELDWPFTQQDILQLLATSTA